MRVVALAVLSTLTLVAHRAAAAPLRLKPGFAPQPLVTQELKVRVDDHAYVSDRWPTCAAGGASYTTKAPALTFDLEAPMDLRIRLDARDARFPANGGAVVVFPDGRYLCESNANELVVASWPRGHYELYLTGSSFELAATLRFEQPDRAAAVTAAAVKAMPHVELGASGVLNPRYQVVPRTPSVDATDAGPTCAKRRERVMPLAWLDVARAAPWWVAAGDHALFVITDAGACVTPDGAVLPVGHHQLWARVPADATPPATFELELDDRAAPPVFAPAAIREVGPVTEPLVIAGTVRPAERWSSRQDACRGAARAPDFYLHSDRPLQRVSLSLLWSHAPARLHIYGPLERAQDTHLRCGDEGDDDAHEFELFEGTYAIWVGGAAGSPYHLLVNRDGVVIDPMTALAPVPDTLTIPDRAIAHHYPYFKGDKLAAWTALFTAAPERLFVYPRAAITADDVTVPEAEPLLVSRATDRQVHAIRHDGGFVTLDARLVTDVKPATVVLPTTIAAPAADSVSRARDLAGPEDAKALAAFHALDTKFSGCMGDYLAAHDPTWGHHAEVYRISGNNVVNVSDQVARAGERRCGASKLAAAEQALLKNLAKTRTARWNAHLAAVRKRFGM